MLKLFFNHREYPDDILNRSIFEIVNASDLCSIATIKNKKESYINTAYFAFDDRLNLFFLSDPNAQHSINIQENPSVAIVIYNSGQPWDKSKRGMQLFGECSLARGNDKLRAGLLYAKRFVSYKNWIMSLVDKKMFKSKFYMIKVNKIKIFDEILLGEEKFVFLDI